MKPGSPYRIYDNAGKLRCVLDSRNSLVINNKLLCLGFFVPGDEGNDEAQSLFVCERKTFEDLCAGLTQPCQCQASARKMIRTVQVCIVHSSELIKINI